MPMKKIITIVIVVVITIVAYNFFKKDSYLGFYYPNGCLTCQEDYIFSPKFNDKTHPKTLIPD